MRMREVAREAWRDIATGTTRAVALALVFGVAVGGLVGLDAATVTGLQNEVQAWRQAGGGVVVFSAQSAVDPRACERLARTAGVTAAGALRERAGGMRADALGEATLPWFEATRGALPLLGARMRPVRGGTTSEPTVLLSESAARTVGRRVGGRLGVAGTAVRVGGIFGSPDDGRVSPLSYAAVTVVPPVGAFDACWMAVWPPQESLTAIARSALSVSAPADVRSELIRLNPTLAATIDPAAMYAGRATRWAPLGVAVLGFCLGFGALRARRVEIASALHARVPRRALTTQHLLETAAWSLSGAAFAVPAVFVVTRIDTLVAPAPVDLRSIGILVLGVLSALLGAAAAMTVTREAHLLAYVKGR